MGTASASSTRATAITAETCSRCNGGGTCASCAQRRKRAWRLVAVAGLSYEEAAARMQLTPEQMRLLVSQERDRQDLARYRLNMIPTERVRAFLERELKRDPRLTRAEVAHYLDMKQIDFDRQLGYEPGQERPQAAQCAGRGREQVGDSARSRPARARRLLRPASAALAAQGDPLSAAAGDRDPRMHGLGTLVGIRSGPASSHWRRARLSRGHVRDLRSCFHSTRPATVGRTADP